LTEHRASRRIDELRKQRQVAAWIKSPHHCANIMEPDFRQMGAAYFVNPTSDTVIYWTQVFGTPTG
jgi:uncharacterized protein YkwD